MIETVRRCTALPLDVHLMVVEPEKYFDDFVRAGASGLTIHAEAAPHLHRQLTRIRELGCRPASRSTPRHHSTPCVRCLRDRPSVHHDGEPGVRRTAIHSEAVDKIRRARLMLDENGSSAVLEVDGGVGRSTIHDVWNAGADTFVAGNAIFSASDPRAEIALLRGLCGVTYDRPPAMDGRRGDSRRVGDRTRGRIVLHAGQLFPVTIGSTHRISARRRSDRISTRSMADYKGQVIVLNVWATWCGPCKDELPSLQRLYSEYGPKGLKLVAVSIDDFVSEDSIRKFANNFGISFEVLHDSTQAIERVYQTTGYPETFVIGPEGTIRKKWIGPDDWNSQGNRALIAQLLGLPTSRPTISGDVPAAVDLPSAKPPTP